MFINITRNEALTAEHISCFKKDINTPKLFFKNSNNVIKVILLNKSFKVKLQYISNTNPLEILDFYLETRDPLLNFSNILAEILAAVREENK